MNIVIGLTNHIVEKRLYFERHLEVTRSLANLCLERDEEFCTLSLIQNSLFLYVPT
jgi:hypothetical protein